MVSTTGPGFRLALGFDPVELSEQRRGYLLDAPCLMGSEVLPPSARLGLAVEFAQPFLLLGDVLPGVLLHHSRQLLLVRRHPQAPVNAPHGPEGVRPEVLVADHYLWTFVGFVGSLGCPDVSHIPLRLPFDEGVGVSAGPVPHSSFGFAPLVSPSARAVPVHGGGCYVPGVPDEQHEGASWEGRSQVRRTHRAVWLLDDYPVSFLGIGKPGIGNPRDEEAYPFEPRLPVRVGHHEILAPKAFRTRARVEIPEEFAHKGLVPQPSTRHVPHHRGQPRAAASARAENPHKPLRSEFLHELHCGRQSREWQSPRKGAPGGLPDRDYRPFLGSIGSRLCRMPYANFGELGLDELRRMHLPRTRVNKRR